jgi:molybdopterin molybdotransferase
MLSFEEARNALLAAARPTRKTECVALLQATGRVLAQDVIATLDVPPADNSAMDGYAFRLSELVASDAALPVSQRIPAGAPPAPLAVGTAARIFTGAQIPPGADVVVMQERCKVEGDMVRPEFVPAAGENIRRAGEDIRKGSQVLAAGTLLRAQELGLIASLGVATVEVFRRLRVAVFFTGDELRMPGEPLAVGQIYNSNRFVLHGLLGEMGCEVNDLGIVADDMAATRAALVEAAKADIVLTCGGVSVGEEDHVKAAVEAEGALQSWRVAIRPGKPLAFGRIGETPFVGLPGNPVSSFMTFQMLVRPYLRRMQGLTMDLPAAFSMRADFAWKKSVPVREFLRVRRNAAGGLDLFPNQGSGVLTSCSWADGVVENPPQTLIAPGDFVRYLPFAVL